MQKTFFKATMAFMVAMTLFSCDKTSPEIAPAQEINNLPKLASTTAYSTLSASEQKQFWTDRVMDFSSGVALTTAQEDVIGDLLDFLEGMDFSAPNAQTTASDFADTWVDDAIGEFSTEVVGLLVGTPIREYTDIIHFYNGDTPTYAVGGAGGSGGGGGGGGGTDKCDCNSSSSWGACQMIGDECPESKTCEDGKGCGFFGLWTCNGECNGGPTGGLTNGGTSVLTHYYYAPHVTISW